MLSWTAQAELAERDLAAGKITASTWHAAREAAALAPTEARAQLVLGNVATFAGDYATARAAFTRALRLDPVNDEVRAKLERAIASAANDSVGYVELLSRDPKSEAGLAQVSRFVDYGLRLVRSVVLLCLLAAVFIVWGSPDGHRPAERAALLAIAALPIATTAIVVSRWGVRTLLPAWQLVFRALGSKPTSAGLAVLLILPLGCIATVAIIPDWRWLIVAAFTIYFFTRIGWSIAGIVATRTRIRRASRD